MWERKKNDSVEAPTNIIKAKMGTALGATQTAGSSDSYIILMQLSNL